MATILLVEDEFVIAFGSRMILEDEGFAVLVAANGEAGLAEALASGPDLIVTDYMMPRMNGLEMIRQLRDHGVRTPIVLATSIPERQVPKDPPPQYDAYLGKPYGDAGLLDVVRRLLAAL
ncbi:response regulator [Cereibacter changlensis JA139]|uniref:Response regulator n=2 Tax=Cereibacter changlensis TaxID=402884 RepID=A0A2T4JTZ3_9RHOB|nr:response regulator [Cereibacter changlensis]PTE21365.1 response regulator [Cereibacter changlensis JA139]PZX56461.1 response regulator receiver domain-containing protein [Cereibacter changlensis]